LIAASHECVSQSRQPS